MYYSCIQLVAFLISHGAAFRIRKVIRDKEGHYIMINGSILQEDRIILNVFAQQQGFKNASEAHLELGVGVLKVTSSQILELWGEAVSS